MTRLIAQRVNSYLNRTRARMVTSLNIVWSVVYTKIIIYKSAQPHWSYLKCNVKKKNVMESTSSQNL
jgi:hypothetical protein